MSVLIDSYLEFLDEAEFVRRVAKGLVRKKDIKKLKKFKQRGDPLAAKAAAKAKGLKGEKVKKAVEKTVGAKPLLKSRKKYEAGIRKGTKRIMRKMGARDVEVPDVSYTKGVKAASAAGAISPKMRKKMGRIEPGKKLTSIYGAHGKVEAGKSPTLHFPKGKHKGVGTYVKRHETGEIKAGSKIVKSRKLGKQERVGRGHTSDEVLRRERELTRVGSKLYGSRGARELKKLRKKGGEYEKLGTKKDIKKREKRARSIKSTVFSGTTPEEREMMRGGKASLKQTLSKKDFKRVLKNIRRTPTSKQARKALEKEGVL
jgi:hypothetical protein